MARIIILKNVKKPQFLRFFSPNTLTEVVAIGVWKGGQGEGMHAVLV